VQPPIDGRTEVPMQLMFRPDARGSLVESGTGALVRAIYFEKYQQMNGIPADILERLLGTGTDRR